MFIESYLVYRFQVYDGQFMACECVCGINMRLMASLTFLVYSSVVKVARSFGLSFVQIFRRH